MKPHIRVPILAIAAGVAGTLLRLWQLTYLDRATNLFQPGAPASAVLPAYLCLTAAVLALLARGTRTAEAFACHDKGYLTLVVAGGFLMLGAGGLYLLESVSGLLQLKGGVSGPAGYLSQSGMLLAVSGLGNQILKLLTGALGVVSGVSALVLGRGHYRLAPADADRIWATFPCFFIVLWVTFEYRDHTMREAELWLSIITTLGRLGSGLGFYYAAAFAYRQPLPRRCLFFSLMGVVLLLTSLADRPNLPQTLMLCACVLLLLGQCVALLWESPEERPRTEGGETDSPVKTGSKG